MSFPAADGSGIRTEELRVRLGDDALRGLGGPPALQPGATAADRAAPARAKVVANSGKISENF